MKSFSSSRKGKYCSYYTTMITTLRFLPHQSREVEATHVFSGRVNKRSLIHMYGGVLFSLTEEGNSNTCHNVDETRGH